MFIAYFGFKNLSKFKKFRFWINNPEIAKKKWKRSYNEWVRYKSNLFIDEYFFFKVALMRKSSFQKYNL